MFKRLLLLAVFSSQTVLAQRYERLIETRTISNHEIVGAEYDASTNAVFILSNVTNQNGNGLLAKVNSVNGDTIWSKFVAPTLQQENFKGLYKSSSSLFAYGLRTFQSAQYAFIAKLDFNGDTIWTKHYKTLATTSCTNPHITINGLTELANGDLVLVGRNNACDRAVLLKTNSLGVVSLIKEYDQWVQGGGGVIQEFYGIVGDGSNYYVSARYASQQNFKGIWKLDLNGDLVTNYNSQFAQNSEIFGLNKDASGNLYLLGQHNPISQNVGILEKFSAAGASLWTYTPSGVTIQWSGITDIEFDASNDVFVSGYFQKQNQSVDQFAAKINAATGAEIWIKQYGYGDNGYGRELVKLGGNFLMVSDEGFGWDARDQYGVIENSPPHSTHPVIQVFNANGQVGKFKKTPWQDSKQGKSQFFAYAAFNFNSSYWSNVNLVPITLASATGGTSGYNAWNNNYNFEIWMSSQNQNGNGIGTFYFTAADKNGDVRSSDTMEVLQPSSFSGEDIYGNVAVAACSGDSLKLVPSILITGSTYKWLYFGTTGTSPGVKVGTGLNYYAKQKGYYALRHVLGNLDSAQSNSVLLTIETDQVHITSTEYPQTFWVSGTASDSTSKAAPNLTDWVTNKRLHQWVAPFGRYRQSNVQQYYYSAADLSARGLSAGSKISEIAFELTQSYSGGTLEDFKIAFRWTTASTNAWITFNSSDIVYDNYWQNSSTSTGSLSFDINDQTWNGTSSLMVQVSYRVNGYNASTDINPVFKLESSTINSSRVLFAQNNSLVLIGNTGAGNKTFMYRPLTRFKIGYPAKTDTIVSCGTGIGLSIQNTGYQALTWNNGATTATRQITSPSLVSVTMVDGNFCVSQDTVRVIFNPNTNQIVSSALKVGPGGTITLSAQPRSINLWSNGASGNTTTVSSSGKYMLTSINSDGCAYMDSVAIEVLTTPVIYKGDRGAYRGTALSGFTYMGKIGSSHVYYSNTCKSWNNAVQNVSQLGGNFWYPKSAADNAAIKSLYNSKVSCCGGKWIGVSRNTTSGAWRDLSGNPVTYTNWDINYNQNGLYGFIEFSWSGFWNASTDVTNECREFFISFDDASSVAAANETTCDSLKLWTPEGFDSYQWTLGATSLTSASNEIWAKNTGVYSVKGVYSGTTYNGSNNVSLTVNASPVVGIINKSGTVDLNGSNSIKLKATYPTGSTVTWYVNGVAQTAGQDSVMSNVVGWHRVVVVNNGCVSQDSVKLSQPIYVAKTGNDATGNGTLSTPYLTIQKGINMVSAGGKVYVLPGVYAENIQISKQLELRSDYDRLSDTNALHTTVINGGGLSLAVQLSNYISSSSTIISGFTIKNGYNSNSEGAGVKIDNVQGAPVYLTNVKLTENSRQCCGEGISFTQVGGLSVLENVRLVNNGSPTFWDERREVTLRAGARSKWNKVKYTGNASQFDVISIMDGSKLEVNNSLFFNNEPQNDDHGLFGLHHQLSELTLNHVTIWSNILGSRSNQFVIKNHGTQQVVRIVNSVIDAGSDKILGHLTGNQLYVRNSVLNGALVGTGPIDSLRVMRKPAFVQVNGALASTSPAIGHARPVSSLQGVSFTNSTTDFIGQSRPNPNGSFADAGAMESPLAQGDFGIDVKNCGWILTANVLNSSNYTAQWSGPNGFSSTSNSITVPQLGTYSITVISIDRLDTLSAISVVQDPLRAVITTRDVCLAAGLNSGYLDIRNVTGGTPYTVANQPTHKWGLRKGSTYIQGPNGGLYASSFWWNSNLTSGSYVVELSDASGCTVEYPFIIADKARRTAFVSTSGNDSNAGTRQSPYRTVAAAVSNACGLDSIVVLDGVYNEDSIFVSKPLVIGSEHILDGNISHIGGTKFLNSENATFFYGGFNTTTGDTINSQLIGLTIEGGVNPHVDQWYGHGGAISVWNSVVKLNRLVLKNNTAKDGGAIGLMGHGFTAVVANCIIEGNTAYNSGGGLTANLTGDLWIRSTSFKNNTANSEGGGLWNQSNLIMSDVIIEGNTAQNRGGFYSSTISPWSSGTKRWSRVIVRNNVANSEFGGGYFQKSGSSSQFILDNVLIVNNASQNYPGIHFGGYDDNRISIINSTIYGNTGSGTSQAAKNNVGFSDNTRIRLLNSIIGRSGGASGYTFYANNCGTKYLMADASSVIVGGAASIYEDQCGGQLVKSLTGIKTSVPFFTDPENGDYSLKSFSALIGAGLASNSLGITTVSPNIAPLTLTATSKDAFGGARPNPTGSSIDIGAVESPLGVGLPGINVIVVGNGVCQTANGSATVNLVQINGQPTGTPMISWVKLGDATWTPQTTTTISNLTSGSYQVTLTVGSSVFIDTAEVTTAPAMSIVNNSLLANCFGDNNGTFKFSIQGGSPFTGGTYKYDIQQLTKDGGVATWNDNSTQERSANFMSTQRSSGTYRISITDAKGCVFVDTLTLGYRNALPTAQITASGSLTICEGEAVSLDATTLNITDTYSWNDGSNLSVNTVGTSGSWSVTVTDTAGCRNSDTVQVNVSPIPTLRTGTPPAQTGGIIGADYAYLGSFNGNHYYIYKYSNSISWSQARLIAQQFGGHLWTINDAAEQAAVTALIQSHPDWYGEAFNGAYFDNGTWKWVTGEPFTYFNWGQNQANNGNGTQIRVQFNWGGQWERYGYQTDQQKFIIEFPEMSRTVSLSEAFCDSVTVFAPEGFDSYTWKNTSNNNAVVGTSRSLTVTSSMAVKVEGTLNKSNGTSCTLESQTHTITINETPKTTYFTSNVKNAVSDTVTISAGITNPSASIVWSNNSSTSNQIVTSTKGWKTIELSANGCSSKDSVNYQWYCDTARFIAMGTVYLRDSIGNKLDSASMSSAQPPHYGVPELKVSESGSYIINSSYSLNSVAEGNGKFIIAIKTSPTLQIVNLSNKVDIDSTSISLVASTNATNGVTWYQGLTVLGTSDTLNVNTQGFVRATITSKGCVKSDSLMIYKPIYVSTNGSNSTGNGSWGSPLQTIQYGVDQSIVGGKVIVRPGVYTESVSVSKPVKIYSDYYWTGDKNAISTTILNSANGDAAIKFNQSNSINYSTSNTHFSGFTVTGKNSSQHDGALAINIPSGNRILVDNLKITGNSVGWGWTDVAAALSLTGSGGALLRDIEIYGNNQGAINNPNVIWVSSNTDSVVFDRFIIRDNYASWGIINMTNAHVRIQNSLIHSNVYEDLIRTEWSNSKILLVNSTVIGNNSVNGNRQFFGFNSNSSFTIVNSILKLGLSDELYRSGGSGQLRLVNSVLNKNPGTWSGNSTLPVVLDSAIIIRNIDLAVDFSPGSKFSGIGRGRAVFNWQELPFPIPYKLTTKDLLDSARPRPAGSRPDIGAIESPKAIGDLDVFVSECGYTLIAEVSNTSNYLLEWNSPSGMSSYNDTLVASEVGLYTLNVFSLDRSDTVIVTHNLQSPLDFDIITAKDVCAGVSSTSGAIRFGRVRGGQPFDYAVTSWTYRTRFLNTLGQNLRGDWTVNNDPNWQINEGGFSAGTYIVEVEDGVGCKVQKQVVLKSKLGRKSFVSTSGSDVNPGTQGSPYATIQHAVDQACDRDTIILLNGTYNQDSIIVNKPLIISSNYLFSGDTNDIRTTIVNGDNNRIFTYRDFSATVADTGRSMLVGITVQNGVTNGRGGGIWVRNENGETALKINRCIIRDNQAQNGGGVATDQWGTYLVVANSRVLNNYASDHSGGIWAHYNNTIVIRNVVISGNSAQNDNGGFMFGPSKVGRYINVDISGNTSNGGTPSGLFLGHNQTTIRNIKVVGNVGGPNSNHHLRMRFDGWGASVQGDELRVSNLLMANNITQSWSGLYLDNGNNYSFINCTFVDNVSRNGGGWNEKGQIVLTDNVSVRLLNSIVTLSNGRTIIANGCNPGSVTIKNSSIEGGANGIQNESCSQNPFTATLTSPNTTTAPYFVDRANGDYRLAKFSSLIGYGAASATLASKTLTVPVVDITGSARPQPVNTSPDAGAYEHPNGVGEPGLNLIVVGNGSCQTANGSATVNLIRINGNPQGTPVISWVKLGDATWTPQSTTTISNLAPGSYEVTVVVGTNPSTTLKDTAVVTTAPSMSIVNNSLLANCFGDNNGTLKFSIQGGSPFTGGTYKYDIQQLTKDGGVADYTDISTQERSANFMATLRSSGTYRISITDAKGCQFVDTITLGYRNALPTAQITASGPLTICEGEAVSLDATNLNITDTYSWNDGSNLSVNTVGTSGSWSVTVMDTAGCSNSDTVIVDVKANPVVYTGTPPAYSGDSLGIDYKYLGQHNGNHYYIYTNTNTFSWTQAKVLSEQFGGHLWVINDAAEQAAVNVMIQTNPVYYGEAYNGAYFEDGAWKWVTGEPFTYFNWAQNQANNGNGTIIRVQFNWGGQWERSGLGNQKFIIEFPNGARNLATSEALCDSVTVSAPEGFDSYVWKNTSNNNAVVGTSRSLKVTSSMALKVEGTLNKSNNTTCTLESQTHTITINQTPAASIVNHSGTTDLYGNDTVVLGANVAAGATWTWTTAASTTSLGSNDTLLVTTPNKYVLKAVSNGCERKDSIIVDKPLFVSVTGNNSTGNGSFAAPYRTIQKGVNKAASGGKVYVLPGNYVESVVVTKPVKIYSDFERLGSSTAIAQTKITSQNGNFSVAIRMDSSGAVQNFTKQNMHISGFTIQGKNASNDMGAIDICPAPSFDWNNISKQKGEVLISNVDFTNNTTQANNAAAFASRGNEVHTYFENVKIRNSNLGVDPRGVLSFWQTKGGTFNNAQIFGNDGIIFNVDGQNMNLTFNNTAIFNNDIKGTTWGGYFRIQGSNNTLEFLNSTLSGNIMTSQDARMFRTDNGSGTKVILKNSILNTSGNPVYSGQVSFDARHSLLPLTSVLALADFTYYDTTNVHSSVARVQGYELLPNSPAIGIGSPQYTSATDIDGKNRPLPAGSNPDAGAFESNLAAGELDLAITSCGYQVTATVLNSKNYTISWSGPGGYSSTQSSPLLPTKGIYQATLIALDRLDTIVRTLNLNNPLEFTITSVKDVCEGVSANSGGIRVSQMKGGSIYQLGWGDYYLRIYRNGSQVWQNNIYNGPTNIQDIGGLLAGVHVVRLEDAVGCFVYDTVHIATQPSNTYFISTSGSDSASGTASNPLKTISEALGRACDGDTIILEDGRHYENVILNNMSPSLTIASRYLLDGDTNHIHNAIVDGSGLNPVFQISDMNNRGSSDTLKLFGFTVTNGLANSFWYGGGGITARNVNISIAHMRAVENRSGQNGGGIGIENSDLKFKNVLIKDNFATNSGGGLFLSEISNNIIDANVKIIGNQANNGGGLYYARGLYSQGQLYRLDGFEVYNNLAVNEAGGIYFNCWGGDADVQLSNSLIIGNRANQQAGGISIQSTSADFNFVNVIIAKNEADYAGAMRVNNSKVHLIHSTVYSNKHKLGSQSSVLNLAVHVENQSTVKMYNSILGGQGTGGKNVFIQDNQSFFEIVSGQLGGGVGNTVQAPNTSQIIHSSSSPNYTNQQVFLKDPNGGDYSLAKVSQAIGRGLSSFTGATFPATDIYGNNRPNLLGSDPDFGAIESNDTAASFGVAFVINDNNACNTSIGQVTAFPQNGSGAYTYSWTALSGGIISNPTGSGVSHTIANLFTGLYRVTVTDVVTNATFTDTAEVRGDSPLVLNKTVVDEGCQGTNSGSISIEVVGGSGFYTYTWLLPNGGGALSTKNIANLAPGIYSVTVTDNKGCSVSATDTVGTAHAQPNLVITSQIIKSGGTTVNGSNDVRMCIGDQVVFNAGPGYNVYEWNKSDGLNTEYTQTVSSYVSETYSVFVEDVNGCSTTGTAKIFVVYEPNVYASNVNRTMGQQFQQVTSYVRGDTSAMSGSGYNDVSPYNAQGNSLKKSQFVISASELQGAGLTENTTINSLAFDVVNPAGVAFQAYKIKLAHTTAQQLGSWQSPTDQQEVFAIPVYAPVQGWNTHNFTSSFAWNGVDNLLVEVCYTPIGNSYNSASVRINQVSTGNTVTNFSYSANTCADPVTNMGVSSWRPTVRFGIDKVEVLDTIRVCDFTTLNTTDDYDTYTWYVNGVASPTAALALNLTSPASVVLAATDAASSCVMYSDTFYVALDTTPSVLATSNIVGAVCAGDSVVLSTPSAGLASYLWSNGDTAMTTTVFESGSYILEARSANGCAGSDTVVVSVNTPPTVVVKLNGKTLTATDGSMAAKANTCVQSVLLPFGENFEDSLYVWTQSATDQLDWTFNTGATNTQFSGPNGDYTTTDSSGNYYYLDRAGANSDDNKEAHLISPCVQMVGANKPYLTFGYHMFNGLYNPANPSSDNMGTLRIEIQSTEDAANYWIPLWSKTGHQGSGWKSDTVDLTPYAGQTIRLRIVGKAGVGGPRSEMAIDGISIIDTANSFANTAGRISADIICEGDVLIAQTISNGSNQFSYVWNTGDTTSTLKVDTTGYYFVSVMDENGCSVHTDSVWIEVRPIPNNALTVTGDVDNCYNETVSVTVQAPLSYAKYSWFSNDSSLVPTGTSTSLVSMQGLNIGNYAVGVRIFDSIGCAAISDTVYVNRFVQPMIQNSVTPVACFGDSTGAISVTPITGAMSWNWSTGDSTSNIAGLNDGMYTLVFTDEHGCSDTASFTVGEPAALAMSFAGPSTSPVSCFGGNDGSIVPTVSGGNGGYAYSWSGPQFTSTLDTAMNLVAGTYILNVTDAKGCFISDTHVVAQPALLNTILDSAWNASCFQGTDGWISVNFAGGNGGYLMNWINALGTSVGSNDTVTNLAAGTYTFIVSDVKGCVDSSNYTVTEPQLLQINTVSSVFVGGNNIRCFGDSSGAITTTTSGGTMPYQWLWSNGATSSNVDSLVAGTYEVVVTDLRGCQDSATVVLAEPTALVGSSTVQDVVCHDEQSGSVAISMNGSIVPYWLDWATTGLDSGVTRVTLVLDLRSASSINSPSVGIVGLSNNIPMTSYQNDSIYYVTLERQAGTPLYYRFYNGASPELVPTSCGVNPPGLTDLHRVLAVGSNDTTLNKVCFASCVDCDGQVTGARSSVLVGSSTNLIDLGAGVITMSITDANGCLVTLVDTIAQPDAINLQLDTIVDVSCPQAGDGSVQLTTTGGIMPYAFDWSNGDTIEDLLNVNEGTYLLTVSDMNGCSDTASYEIMAPVPYNFEEICMMTVDSLTGKNQVVWNKTPGQRTMEYQIFKETNVAGQYAQIGTVPYLNMSVFTDVNSVPQQQPDRYKIVAVDSCGSVSDTSDLHRTIHLQSSFGSGGEVNLSWTDYEGRAVQTYDIFRWVSTGNLVQIGSVSGATTTFSDLNPPVAPNVYYNVRAIFAGGACAPAVGKTNSYESARSNILDQTGIGMPDMPWKGLARMYPNPTTSVVRIEVPEAGFTVRVTNLLGQLISEVSAQEAELVLDLSHVAAGMYQVELFREGQVMSIDKLHVLH